MSFELLRAEESVEKKQGEKYVRIFNQAGKVSLKAEVKYGECSHVFQKTIQVYDAQYLSFGNKNQNIEENFSEFFEKNNILFVSLPHKDENYDISTSQ